MSVALEPRVETLESLMADTLRVVRETSLEVDRMSREMRDFKGEMRDFKTEMRDFKHEMNKKWGDVVGCGVFLVVEGKIKVTVDAVNAFADRMPEARAYFADYADRGCRAP